MTIGLNAVDNNDFLGWLEEWYLPARPAFLRSHPYEILKRELRRYVAREIPGRSFLIAGHRGAGKTMLVQRAVEDLRREIILNAVTSVGRSPGTGDRQVNLERPFLVKLHGSSLVTSAKSEGLEKAWPIKLGTGNHSAETALQQITVALYRALAGEIANAFALHARALDYRPSPDWQHTHDLPELAGQLTLDLDQSPDITALRAFWQRMDKLSEGVLWPRSVGRALSAGGLRDRGVREILALATANQAFQVCTGKIESSQFSRGSAEREASLKLEAKASGKDIANKLWGLAAGALVGGLMLAGPDASGSAAAGAGFGAALLSTLALSWSSTRLLRNQRGMEYTFIVDKSVQTLDRDLPLVIERVREAGLAPVFVIDELDKVVGAADVIATIINRLKNLTTDYGFFCFLTDRAYYEDIERKTRSEAFPTEHTYFSHRLLVFYRPDELAEFVRRLWSVEPPTDRREESVVWILTSVVLHRARLNTIDIMREIARLCDDNGKLRPSLDSVLSGSEYLVPMAVQLAIEHVLRRPELRARTQGDPAFTQLAIDALYLISRAWEDGGSVRIDEDSICLHLLERRRITCATVDERRKAFADLASEEELKALLNQLEVLAKLLCSFSALRDAIASEAELPSMLESERQKIATLLPLLNAMPGKSVGLLAQDDPGVPEYRFLFDEFGQEREITAQVQATAAAAGAGQPTLAPAQMRQQIAESLQFFDRLEATISHFGLSLQQIVDAGILPRSVVHSRISEAANRLRGPLLDTPPPTLASDISMLAGFCDTARAWSRAIAVLVALADLVREDAQHLRPDATVADALSALDRMLGVVPLAEDLAGVATRTAELKSPDSLLLQQLHPATTARAAAYLGKRTLRAAITTERRRLARARSGYDPDIAKSAIWDAWHTRLVNWFQQPNAPLNPAIGYADIVFAAADRLPSRALRPDLNQMSAAEWSQFATLSFDLTNETPIWAVQAGLRALGFGRRLLSSPPLQAEDPIAADAGNDQPGTVLLYAGDATVVTAPQGAPRSGLPIFAVPWNSPDASATLLVWLRGNGGVADEVVERDE